MLLGTGPKTYRRTCMNTISIYTLKEIYIIHSIVARTNRALKNLFGGGASTFSGNHLLWYVAQLQPIRVQQLVSVGGKFWQTSFRNCPKIVWPPKVRTVLNKISAKGTSTVNCKQSCFNVLPNVAVCCFVKVSSKLNASIFLCQVQIRILREIQHNTNTFLLASTHDQKY